MALWRRKPAAGLVHHSDRGVQYTPRCRSASGLKKEVSCPLWAGWDRHWITPSLRELCGELEVRAALRASLPQPGGGQDSFSADYIVEGFYNRVRRHSSLGYSSPDDYEQATIEEGAVA
jgi:putative transposase